MPLYSKFSATDLLIPKSASELGLSHTSLRRIELTKPHPVVLQTAQTELALVALEGNPKFSVILSERPETQTTGAVTSVVISSASGTVERNGVLEFQDILFVPPGSLVSLEGVGVLMAYEAPSELGAPFAHIRFREIDQAPARHRTYGKPELGTFRHVWHAVDDSFPCSRLMLGFCHGSAGGWTAWPPHEHGAEREEVYVYYGMGKGFGIQCVYQELSEPGIAMVVRDGDVVTIPEGFHPNVGSPAGGIRYVYCMTAKIPGKRAFLDLRIQKEYGEVFS